LSEGPPPEALVVLRFSALGDVLLTTPALEALHMAWPRTRILVAVKARLAPLLAGNPDLAEVVPLEEGEGPLAYALRLRRHLAGVERVAVLDLHGKLRSVLLRALLPWRWRTVVWRRRPLVETLGVKLRLRPARVGVRFADRYHAAAEALVGRPLPRGRLRAFVNPADLERARGLLRGAGLSPDRPLLGLSPGAAWATKRWPLEHYAELARLALAAGVQVAVQGSLEERPLGSQLAAAAPGAVDLCGRLDLGTLGGFTSLCTAFVTNDTGPLHLARALGVPTLAFFGSTDPAAFGWDGHRVLFAGLACAPCSFYGRRRCPLGHLRCLTDLGPHAAWSALQPLLEGGRRPSVDG
jgi:heptosyltransferase-2